MHKKHKCLYCERTFMDFNGAGNPLAVLNPRLVNNKIVFNTVALNSVM